MKLQDRIFAVIGLITSVLVGIVFFTLIGGFIVQILWGWFIIPIFHLKSLTIAEAIGLSLVVRYFQYNPDPNTKTTPLPTYLVTTVFFWIITLFFGFIIHLFI